MTSLPHAPRPVQWDSVVLTPPEMDAFRVGRDDRSTLPTIQGHGLDAAEYARIQGARNRVRAAYAAEVPEADSIELDGVERRAAGDALRSVLRDRPAAAAIVAHEAGEEALEPKAPRRSRRAPFTSADLAWAAQELNADAQDFEVLVEAPRPISGGSPEATEKAARPRAKAKPADVCRLSVMIRGMAYSLRPLASEDGRAWRLRKGDGTAYDVAETPHGPTCDCADQTFRHEGTERMCKHLRAMRAVGLLEGSPVPLSAHASRWDAWTDEARYTTAR